MSEAAAVPVYPSTGSSGQAPYNPALAEFLLDALGRIQIRGAAITIDHVVQARRSMNIFMADWPNRGINLFSVGDPDIFIPLVGAAEYVLPGDTEDLLDCYRRVFTPGSTYTNVGNALSAFVTQDGHALVTQPYGDPLVIQPGSQTLSCVAGSLYATLRWPAHGQIAGNPLFWQCPITIGGLTVYSFSVVSVVLDSNNLQFMLPFPALESQTLQGGTPLFTTSAGSSTVNVVSPGHGLSPGDPYPVPIAVTVGGITLPAASSYTVSAVLSPYEFSFVGPSTATSADSAFENEGKLSIGQQLPGLNYTDIYVEPISRNTYAGLPNKYAPGPPTSLWFNRVKPPSISIWPVPPPPTTGNGYWALVGHRAKSIQIANPVNGQTLGAPSRFFNPFVAELTAALAEHFKPEVFKDKVALAAAAWERAANEDTEKVSFFLRPNFGVFTH